MNAGVTVNTLGNPHTLSGLPNKNADIANFRKVRVQNTSGLDAVLDSKSILVDMPNQLSDAEKNSWKTAMNGGWTTNTMSVGRITPFLIPSTGNARNTWILLEGANLNILSSSSVVTICDINGSDLVVVPNSQVNYLSNGKDLQFYYNFFTLGLGKYKVKLFNGVAQYITNQIIEVTDSINYLSLSGLTWNIKRYNDIVSSNQFADNTQFYYKVDANVKPLADENIYIFNAKLSNISFSFSENFVISFNIIANLTGQTTNLALIGITDNPNALLSNDFLAWIGLAGASGAATRLIIGGNAISPMLNGSPIEFEINKNGNTVTIFYKGVKWGDNTIISGQFNFTVNTTNNIYFGAIFPNRGALPAEISGNILQIYKYT